MLLSIISIIIGVLVTWFFASWYYNRSKDDFLELIAKIDKIAANQNDNNHKNYSNASELKFNNIFTDTENIGKAIMIYAKTSGAEMGSPESGIPIYALDNLIERINRIKTSLQSYRDWRAHLGA